MKTVTLRLADELHEDANSVLEEMGLDMPTAFRVFLTKVATTRSIPFELKAEQMTWEEVPVDSTIQKSMDKVAALWTGKKPAQS
jgi:addiction module RelB/DinJ family antitoxin